MANGSSRDLNDDMVKLVSYAIVSIQREYERVLDSGYRMVVDNMSGEAFASWMIADYLQSPQYRRREAAYHEWREKHDRWEKDLNATRGPAPDWDYLGWEPVRHDAKQYLRVYYNVQERWPKQDLHYEEKQLRALDAIAIGVNRPPRQASATT